MGINNKKTLDCLIDELPKGYEKYEFSVIVSKDVYEDIGSADTYRGVNIIYQEFV